MGTTVTIAGSGFSTTTTNNMVSFNGIVAFVPSATSTQLVVYVPVGATSGPLNVTVLGNSSAVWNTFTVTDPPTISDISPTSGGVRTTVTISGQNFGTNPTDNTVFFQGQGSNRTQATVTAASNTQLTVTVPDDALTGPIYVYVGPAYARSPADFTVVPTLTANVTLTAPDAIRVGERYWLAVAVAPTDQTDTQPGGTVYVYNNLDDASCLITLGQDSGCVLLAQARGTARITAGYRGDSHYLSASATPLTRNVLGVPLYGFNARISGAEPSQAGYGIWVAPVMNTSLGNASGLILPNYHQPNGFVYASDGVNSCSVAANTAANPSCFLNTPAAGTRAITISYSGDDMWEPATAPPMWHSTSSAGGANTLPPQTQICGFDPNATYAAQTGFVPIEQLASAVPSMGLVPGITGNQPLTVAVTSPAANSTTPDGIVDVVGTYTGPANTGITVNGIIANTLNGQFVANNVPLDPGANTLNVVATTLPGATASANVSVVRGGTPGPISISIADSGTNVFAPASIGYNYALAPLPNGAAVSTIRIDFGTGIDPWIGSDTSTAPGSVSYTVPGVTTLKLSVTDNRGNTYTAQRTVLVQDLVAKRSMLCDVYGYLKDRLNAQDAIGAASVYQPLIHDQYQNQFTAFDSAMPSAASQLGTIATGRVAQSYADMTLVRDNADQTRSGFPLRMTQGSDGVWRISEM